MSKDVREGIARGSWTRWVRPGSIRLPAAKMRASIDVENVASDCRGVGQIHHGVRDVLDCRRATHRGQTFHDFLGFVPLKRRINNARRDGVDADAILRVLHRKMLGDRCKTAFRDHWDCGLYARIGLRAREAVIVTTLPPLFCASICFMVSWVRYRKPSTFVDTSALKSSTM